MNLLLSCLLLLLVACTRTNAHIKIFFEPWRMPIRNAPALNSDGIFSASANAACGGSETWGLNNRRRYAEVVDGQTICARVNWNGGHTTTIAQNKLRAVYQCGQPDRQDLFLRLPPLQLVDGTWPLPDNTGQKVSGTSTNSLWDGYTLCVNLSRQGITYGSNIIDRRCTLSIMQETNWGGCLDVLLHPDVNATIEPLVPQPTLTSEDVAARVMRGVNITASEGTYRITDCMPDSGGKCCLTGYLGILPNGAVSGRFSGTSGYTNCLAMSAGYFDFQGILRPSKWGNGVYETNFYLYMGGDAYGKYVIPQNVSIVIRDGGSIVMSNIGLDIPYVSDHVASYAGTLIDGVEAGYIPYPNYSTSPDVPAGATAFLVIFFLGLSAYLIGGVAYSRHHGGPWQHPHIHQALVALGIVRKGRALRIKSPAFSSSSAGGGPDSGEVRPASNATAPAAAAPTPAEPVKPAKPPALGRLQLPPNWKTFIDHASGEVYYFNVETKETTWSRPKA